MVGRRSVGVAVMELVVPGGVVGPVFCFKDHYPSSTGALFTPSARQDTHRFGGLGVRRCSRTARSPKKNQVRLFVNETTDRYESMCGTIPLTHIERNRLVLAVAQFHKLCPTCKGADCYRAFANTMVNSDNECYEDPATPAPPSGNLVQPAEPEESAPNRG